MSTGRFTRIFRSEVEANPAITLHELYYHLATHSWSDKEMDTYAQIWTFMSRFMYL